MRGLKAYIWPAVEDGDHLRAAQLRIIGVTALTIVVFGGLAGALNFIANFERFLSDMRARGERLAVIQIDLDRFKQINDTLGHAAGDMVLSRTAQRMRQACRAKDICVRLGGDERRRRGPGATR